jgi:DNA repair photolyase
MERESYDYQETKNYEKTLVCNKGDIVLESYNYHENNKKAYSLFCNFDNINTSNININALLSSEIYQLLEKINPELIERIYILKQLNENETDICILFKPIAKELGIKQKYILFRTSKSLDIENKKIIFDNKDLSLINKDLVKLYLDEINLNLNKYEPIIFNFGKTLINLNQIDHNEIIKLNNNETIKKILTINFQINFQLLIKDELPIYMEHLTGLILKKLFYNLKQFIDKVNNNNTNVDFNV